ncbi:uncharacterized protein LOC132261488 [Phlebotomus argentipes]|uniref:uncharacterized protein LOC132261488 n=1 Tax=Phlebotomus argentipes TaxID=94469 RepID=UPI002892A172|nr:uncharacterized protein LOC132261488 [Phlebotomus argentipes]
MILKSITILSCITLVTLVPCAATHKIPSDLRSRIRLALHMEQIHQTGAAACEAERPPPCPPSKFRSPTGECNNINHRDWGARGDILLRLFESNYADGKAAPRTSRGAHALPPPESVLTRLQATTNAKQEHPHVTAMLPAWGQLLAYDLVETLTPSLTCCPGSSGNKTQEQLALCYTSISGEECVEYRRSAPSYEVGLCDFKQREQMNSVSGYIDGSGLYGASESDFQRLRTHKGGLVNISACARCNEQGAVGALHTILLREHNRIAAVLSKMNPVWTDTTLFLETRRAVTAQIQHITYNEFLPVVLGQQITAKDELRLETSKHYDQYSSTNRGGVFNEVAVAALPAFLTMLPAAMMDDSASAEILIRTPALVKTLIPLEKSADKSWTEIALALQRGRDHGIPAYSDALNLCEARLATDREAGTSFDDFQSAGIPESTAKALKNIYLNAADVDLLIGALSETPQPGSVFGPTLSCLLATQFASLRNSDRFWYENDLPPSSLSLDQLKAVRRVSLSGLLCAADGVSRSQPKAFIREDPYLNARLTCDQLSGLDLSAWKFEDNNYVEDTLEETTRMPDVEELSPEQIKEALRRAQEDLAARKRFEYEVWLEQGGIDARSPDGTAASFSKANRNALLLANSSLFYEFASNEILNTLHKNQRRKRQTFDSNILGSFSRGDDFTDSLQNIDVNSLLSGSISPINLEPQCEDLTAQCDSTSPFRSMSGYCNNLRSPNLGQSLTVFARLLPPVYEDGVSKPRITSVSGQILPNPRTISSLIHPDISNLHTRYSLMVMQYAQFLDHDLTMTPIHKGFHESIPNCRSCDSPRTVHPECNPFPVPPRDHYYPEVNVTSGARLCFPFMRSLPGQQSLGPREQVNQNTAFLDASQVYGENWCVANKLRGFSGRMNSTIHPIKGKELLPQSPSHPECKAPSGYCFIAGDGRASEQPALTVIHTIFLREHNRIVEGLRGVNPHWSGDQLFEHARRILIAQNQHITYNEFLPRILSWNAVNLYGLKLLPQGYYKDYNPTCNPAIVTEFAAAAFRIGHSLLRPHIPRLSPNHQPIDPPILLRDGFFKPDMILQPGMVDEISRGLVSTPMETLDQFITGEVTNHLFEDRRIPFSGIDLIALNVQRARDHGIPSYNNYRALCNLKRANDWDDLSREIPPEVIARFKRLYASVDDIDLFPGAMSERPLQGGLVGPTFACIIAIQFRQLRKCDRFWYENEDPAVRFSEAQLSEIRKTTLAKIFCENLDIPGDMQRAAFDLPSNFLNPRVPCHTMPQIDLSAWRENVVQGCQIGGRHVSVGESAFPSPCTSCICTSEGAQCASLRITDCAQLAREWPRDVILRDDVCSAQCGLVLQNNGAGSSNIPGLTAPPLHRAARSRSLPVVTFQGFRFPDLSPFIG